MKTVIVDGIGKNSVERSEQRVGDPVQELLETAVVVSSCQIEHDLQTDYPVAHTKKVIDKLIRPD